MIVSTGELVRGWILNYGMIADHLRFPRLAGTIPAGKIARTCRPSVVSESCTLQSSDSSPWSTVVDPKYPVDSDGSQTGQDYRKALEKVV